jgi:ribosome biogenesis ATPase
MTPGYVGADLSALITTAGMFSVKRIFGTLAASAAAVKAMKGAVITEDSEVTGMDVDGSQTKSDAVAAQSDLNAAPTLSDIALFLESHPDPLTESELAPLAIEMQDFAHALKKVQPSSKREGFATVPDVAWSDIGALEHIRDELRMTIVEPIKNPGLFAKVGISNPAGVLLWGPPGCGKTLLAKAVANESHCNFISVKGPELLNKVGLDE